MQSICLDEVGGEKAFDTPTKETTLIHHIFGGYLQSQVQIVYVATCKGSFQLSMGVVLRECNRFVYLNIVVRMLCLISPGF